MDRLYDIVTFDCYGTLIDWDAGISEAFLAAAAADGVSLRREDVLRAYERVEPAVERESYRPYAEVLTEGARRVARELGWELAPERAAFLAHSLPSWRPFPDTNAALERLRGAGHQLGILSNIDDALFAETRKHFTVDFDLVVTAQQVRSYKPAHGHWIEGRRRIGERRWLHAAQSNFHDVVPANALGLDTAWVNRRGEAALPGGRPLREVPDLRSLAEWLVPQDR